MKKSLIITMLLVLGLLVVGGSAMAAENYRVAYIARAQGDSFAAWLANSIKAEAERYDNINLTVFDGQADNARVNTLIENAIVNQYDVVILQPNNIEAQRPYAEQVMVAGIPLITTNPRIPDLSGGNTVDVDPYDQGAVVARYAKYVIPKGAKVVVLNGPAGNMHSNERRRAWEQEFFEERPDVEVLGEQIANWNKSEAMDIMEDWITAHEHIDAIISMNDNMAAGALEVVDDSDIQAYGVDGTAEAMLLIAEGKMTATCMQNAYELAEINLKVVNRILEGEENIDINIGTPLITSDNVEAYKQIHIDAGNL